MSEQPRAVALSAAGVRLFARWLEVSGARGGLVLLPGLGFHSFEYERLQALLAEEGLPSLALDYRGHGRSEGRPGDWTLDLLVADTRAAIDWVSAEHAGPVVLVGNSLGAMVAIATGKVDPRVRAVVASNCPAHVRDFLMTPFRSALFAIAQVMARIYPLRISVNHFYSYADLIEDPQLLERIGRDQRIRSARRLSVAAYRALLDEWDGVREVAELTKPLLLVHGAHDRLQPGGQADLLLAAANEPKRRVCLDTGHLPNLERPELLADAVAQWLSLIGLRSRP